MTEDLEGNDMLTKEQYLADPCKAASIPHWKAQSITILDGMKILHQDEYDDGENQRFVDEPYFRLIHNLKSLAEPVLPQGYSLCTATLSEYAAHISSCYEGIGITEEELRSYTARPVYDTALWLAVKDDQTGNIVATGIAELDREIGEGVLEWIQVSQVHRGKGLGRYIVSELLWRMKGKAGFATVSGQCNNASNPEKLYRKCGFTGNDVWHILRKKKTMVVELRDRTANTVIAYFQATRDPEVRKYLPQKATTETEALADFEKTQQPEATSYGRTIYVDGNYIGDVWCYCIQQDEPNAMVSYCIFDKAYWSKGIATEALRMFLAEIVEKFGLKSVGAFTYSSNESSIKVLLKNGFIDTETFVEDGIESKYFQKDM